MTTSQIKVELFGIPRLRAGVAEFFVEVDSHQRTLENVFIQIEKDLPDLARELFVDGQLRKDFVVNISGNEFTRSKDKRLAEDDSVLLMSSDAGG